MSGFPEDKEERHKGLRRKGLGPGEPLRVGDNQRARPSG